MSVVPASSFELRSHWRRTRRGGWKVGTSGFLDEGQGVVAVGLIFDVNLEPVGVAWPEMDPDIRAQPTTTSPDGALG